MTGFWRAVAVVAWPAFLLAAALEVLVFALADPLSLHTLSGEEITLSRNAIYSVAFFVFWLFAMAGGMLTLVLARSARRINREGPLGAADR